MYKAEDKGMHTHQTSPKDYMLAASHQVKSIL